MIEECISAFFILFNHIATHSTNKTLIFNIFLNIFLLLSQIAKSINDNTRSDFNDNNKNQKVEDAIIGNSTIQTIFCIFKGGLFLTSSLISYWSICIICIFHIATYTSISFEGLIHDNNITSE